MFLCFLFVLCLCLGELNAAELALIERRQHTPGRRELERLQQVRAVLLHIQPRCLRVLGVDHDRVDVRVASGLVRPAGVEVRLDVVQTLQLGLRTCCGRRCADLLPLPVYRCSDRRYFRHEVHAQDTNLARRGDLACLRRLRHNRDEATLLGGQDIPLGRRLKRFQQAALNRCDVLVKVRGGARLRQLDAVPLDGVALSAASVLTQRDERHREVLPNVLTQDQLRAVPASVRVRQGQTAELTQRRQGCRRIQQRLVAPRETGVVHTSVQLVKMGRVSEDRHLRRKGGKGGKREERRYVLQ